MKVEFGIWARRAAATVAAVGAAGPSAALAQMPPAGPAIRPGDVVVGDFTGASVFAPDGTARGAFPPPLGSVRAAAVTSGGVFFAWPRPNVRRFDLDGRDHGRFGGFLEGLSVTALAGTPGGDVYVALSDGQFLHEIYRFTPEGVAPFLPYLVADQVTALDADDTGCIVAYGLRRGGVGLLDACSRVELPRPTGSRLVVAAVRIAPDRSLVVAPARRGPIMRVSADGKLARASATVSRTGWTALDLTPDGRGFWAAERDGTLDRFDLRSGTLLQRVTPAAPLQALAVAGAPHFPAPRPAPPAVPTRLALDGVPTLTGEGLSSLDNAGATSPSACSPGEDATFELSGRGASIGPYRGSFEATATATVGPQVLSGASGVLGLPPGPLNSLAASFSIDARERSVEGTLNLAKPGPPNVGVCAIFASRSFDNSPQFPPGDPLSGYDRGIYARRLTYEARIAAGGRTYVDRGTAAVTADEYYLEDTQGRLRGLAKRLHASFVSTQVAVVDAFRSRSATAAHAAAIPPATASLRIVLRWPRARDRFALTGIRLVRPRRSLQAAEKLRPGKLRPGGIRVRVVRGSTSVTATVTNLSPGSLTFGVKPSRLSGATTAVTAVAAAAG